jgi:competence protein ComEA
MGRNPSPPPRDPPGYLLGKLDLDAATVAQIDSLPGIGPTLAKRITADRAERGPFLNLQGFGRVPGVGASLIRRLDTLVTFSGTLRPLSATPESVSARSTRRHRPKR